MPGIATADLISGDTVKIETRPAWEGNRHYVSMQKYEEALDAFLDLTHSFTAAITLIIKHDLTAEYLKERRQHERH